MCRSMVDIQSTTAEIRRGKKKKKKQDKIIVSASATQGGHNNITDLTGTLSLPFAGGNGH